MADVQITVRPGGNRVITFAAVLAARVVSVDDLSNEVGDTTRGSSLPADAGPLARLRP